MNTRWVLLVALAREQISVLMFESNSKLKSVELALTQ